MKPIKLPTGHKGTVLITGCSSHGLGAELALALHALDWNVIASARDLDKLAQFHSTKIRCVQLDVVSNASIEKAVTVVQQMLEGEPLDMLINNAGAGVIAPVMDSSSSSTLDIFNLNVCATIEVTKAFLPLLRTSYQPRIVNHTSLGSIFATPSLGVYNASKSAAAMLSRVLRMEVRGAGIKVIELKTGRVQSRFFENAKLRGEQCTSPYQRSSRHHPTTDSTDRLAMDSASWASQVATDLSRTNPPDEIWRGGGVFLARVAYLLPTWVVDWGASAFVNVSSGR